MSRNDGIDERVETADDDTDRDLAAAASVELLEAENRRLRAEYARIRQRRYRNTAVGLAALGLVAAGGGAVFPDGREVLFALAATGLFGAVLTYYLTPGQVVAADVGERVYSALADNEATIAAELGLREDRIYVPQPDGPAALFVPRYADATPPPLERGAETRPFLLEDDRRGLVLRSTGGELYAEFERTLSGPLAGTPVGLATQLADGLTDGLELVGGAEVDVEDGRATVAVTDSAFGAVDRFDHPAASFLATGFATGLERPVTLAVEPGDERADWLVTCRWETREGAAGGDEETDGGRSSEPEE
ncbi:hypothetical protein [Natrononativus amylolyticus]|uniref:hypothetical protein n=1 Tax=Natrononativus amylolyticus TaxID=2963434 RepID=UPI0020CF4437|nr:hypothetical protein [Natrononativus amylolyticus]